MVHSARLAGLAAISMAWPDAALSQAVERMAAGAAERTIQQCQVCHQMKPGGAQLSGPSLYGVFGRKAGSLQGYAFSPALAASGIVWNDTSLDAYLAAPPKLVPGTRMVVRVSDPELRAAVIAFLKSVPAR